MLVMQPPQVDNAGKTIIVSECFELVPVFSIVYAHDKHSDMLVNVCVNVRLQRQTDSHRSRGG